MQRPTVVITRPDGPYAGARHLREALSAAGCDPYHFAVLTCERIALSDTDRARITAAISRSNQWLVFLSPTAVTVFRDLLREELAGASISPSVAFAVQGTGSAEVLRSCFGREADFIPSAFVAEHFADEFLQRVSRNQQVLVAQSSEGRNVFAQKLQANGIAVDTVTTYTTRSSVPAPADIERVVDLQSRAEGACILFMSPSAVHATVAALGARSGALSGYRIVSVGPITTRAVRSYGLSVAAEAVEHSEGGIVRALQELLGGK